MRKHKAYIYHIYFEIATFLKTGIYIYIYKCKKESVTSYSSFTLKAIIRHIYIYICICIYICIYIIIIMINGSQISVHRFIAIKR